MLFILMTLLCCGEYKRVQQGSGQKVWGAVLVRREPNLVRVSFAGLCNGTLTEEIGEFFFFFFLPQTGTFLSGDPK